ncbi:hypothetical protein [uncultured Draconibacterium sp.]|uniref:hypothetical protein n=1 Tax=uncultured Draconibacterium sp. TaxID=1573823 RepID=UPI003216C233
MPFSPVLLSVCKIVASNFLRAAQNKGKKFLVFYPTAVDNKISYGFSTPTAVAEKKKHPFATSPLPIAEYNSRQKYGSAKTAGKKHMITTK